MKLKATISSLFILSLFAANTAWAQLRVNTMSVPEAMENPLGGFEIEYSLGGSKYGVGAASAVLSFYISASPDGSTGVALLSSGQILLDGSGFGPYYPPSGTRTEYISRFTMPDNTEALLESIADACEPQTWYILGDVDFSLFEYDESLLGSSKRPDFFFTGGTMSPSVIQPGGTTNISFDVFTRCPASTSSTVGIFLADADYQPLAYIGGVFVAAGAGTSTLPPTPISFSPFIPTGVYHIVLIADVDDVIAESNEDNNVGDFTLQITSSSLAAAEGDAGKLETDVELPVDFASDLYDLELGAPDQYIDQYTIDRFHL